MSILMEVLRSAKYPEDVFGQLNPLTERTLDLFYKQCMREVHPDVNHAVDANDLAAKLQDLYQKAHISLRNGTFGCIKPLATVRIQGNEYQVFNELGKIIPRKNVVATSYPMSNDKNASQLDFFFDLVNHPRDNDLMTNEVKVLNHLFEDKKAHGYFRYLPSLFTHIDYREGGLTRKANVFFARSNFVSLTEALQMYPHGIPAENVVWIIRRVLDVLGYIHKRGIIHSGVIPDNIFIGVGHNHEVELRGFYASVFMEDKKYIPLLLDSKIMYPLEVLRKEVPTPSIDMYTFANSIILLIDQSSHGARYVISFLNSMLFLSVQYREQSAYKLRDEFTQLTNRIWEKQKYLPFNKG